MSQGWLSPHPSDAISMFICRSAISPLWFLLSNGGVQPKPRFAAIGWDAVFETDSSTVFEQLINPPTCHLKLGQLVSSCTNLGNTRARDEEDPTLVEQHPVLISDEMHHGEDVKEGRQVAHRERVASGGFDLDCAEHSAPDSDEVVSRVLDGWSSLDTMLKKPKLN